MILVWSLSTEVAGLQGITQARQRLGYERLRELFGQVAVPVAELLTRGAFLAGAAADGDRRL